jgi:hypothetical protein
MIMVKYGERCVSSFWSDFAKLLRVKQIENKGKTIVSEGIDANYQDMINYSIFALILMVSLNKKKIKMKT